MRDVEEKSKLYKKKYSIAFYDEADEDLMYIFDNPKEIVKFLGKELTRKNLNNINAMLYYGLKDKNHITKMLGGKNLKVYLIKIL